MKTLLVIVFLMGGEWKTADGWHAIEVDAVVCEERRQYLNEYLEDVSRYEFKTECVPL